MRFFVAIPLQRIIDTIGVIFIIGFMNDYDVVSTLRESRELQARYFFLGSYDIGILVDDTFYFVIIIVLATRNECTQNKQ